MFWFYYIVKTNIEIFFGRFLLGLYPIDLNTLITYSFSKNEKIIFWQLFRQQVFSKYPKEFISYFVYLFTS